MSDNNEVELEFISKDCVIPIEVHSSFYKELINFMITYSSENKVEDIMKIFLELREREPKNDYEHNLLILLTLIGTIEESAKKHGFVTYEKFIMPSQEDDHES